MAIVADSAREAERIRDVYARRQEGGRYGWDRPGHVFDMQSLERAMLGALGRHDCLPLGGLRILEVGCGRGHFLRQLVTWGADPERVVGIDLLEDRLADARRRAPEGLKIECRNAAETGYPAGTFDLILQMTVFTSILSEAVRLQVAAEMRRLLAPGGRILWYDLRVDNPRNPDVRRVGKAELRRLFPSCELDLRPVTLAPPLARPLARRAWFLALLLERLPFLRTHYLAVITPR